MRFQKGFTLLEIIVSLGIMATALLAVYSLQAQSLDLSSESVFLTDAGRLARDRFSILRSQGRITEGSDSGDFGEAYSDYRYRQEIRSVLGFDHLFRVDLHISRETDRSVRVFETTTLVHRPQS